MANNRLHLVHRPTGRNFCIGKRMGWGWYVPPAYAGEKLAAELAEFFIGCEEEAAERGLGTEAHDDFDLVIEQASRGGLGYGSQLNDKWRYMRRGDSLDVQRIEYTEDD